MPESEVRRPHHTKLDFPFAPVPEALLYDNRVTPLAVRLWAVLARHNLDPESCFPSHPRLADFLGVSIATTRRALRELEEMGWMKRFDRKDERGATLPNGYEPLTRMASPVEGGCSQVTTGGCSNPAPSRARSFLSEIEQEQREELKLLEHAPSTTLATVGFDDFWLVYPRRTGKGAARKQWEKAIKLAEPTTIIKAAERYRDDPNRDDEYTCHPSTWLHQERWSDDPLPARRGSTPHDRTLANIERVFNGGGR